MSQASQGIVALDTANFDLDVLLQSLPTDLLHIEDNQKTFECDQCRFNSNKKDSLWIHVKLVHDTSFFSCEHCDRRTKTEEALSFHTRMKHMDETGRAIEQESCSKRMGLDLKPDSVVTEDVDSIRSKFVLSKAVEGLETLPIVTSSLTTKQVYMMEREDSGPSFQFKKKRPSDENVRVDANESFFRPSDELEDELNLASNSVRIYLGNIKKQKAFHVLKDDFLCVTDCDAFGNLKAVKSENMVFLKLVKCQNEHGKQRHLAICLKCNSDDNTNVIIDSLHKNVKVSSEFVSQNLASCTHASIGEILFCKEASMNESSCQENCKIVIDDEKTHLAISFDGKSPALVCFNKSKKAKKGRCLKCNSIRCAHVQAWNQELKKSVLKISTIRMCQKSLMKKSKLKMKLQRWDQ